MEENLKIFINGIKDKTGLQIAVFNPEGVCVAGVSGVSETVDRKTEGFVSDKVNGRTLFSFTFRNKTYIGRIAGAGEVELNYAKLIKDLSENYFQKDSDMTKSEFYKAALFGEINYSQTRRAIARFSIPESPCFAMIITALNGTVSDIKSVIKNYNGEKSDFVVEIEKNRCAFVKFTDETSEDYQSSTEYAEYLSHSALEEEGIKLNIAIGGTVKSIGEINSSYLQAVGAVRMGKAIQAKGEIHSYKDYILIKILEDLPKYKLNEYLEILMDDAAKEIFRDDDMLNTAEEFLENSLNISETSRKLYMHRNTLMYRLDKIEKATGLNIRKFSDAVTFRLITLLSKLVK